MNADHLQIHLSYLSGGGCNEQLQDNKSLCFVRKHLSTCLVTLLCPFLRYSLLEKLFLMTSKNCERTSAMRVKLITSHEGGFPQINNFLAKKLLIFGLEGEQIQRTKVRTQHWRALCYPPSQINIFLIEYKTLIILP